MDLKRLRTFVTVAKEGNLTRAADRLHLTQPAASLQLKALQESLDLALFIRTAQGLALTADGQALLGAAERVLSAVDDFQSVSDTLRQSPHGELRLGTILNPEFIRLGIALQHMVNSYPHARATLRHGMSGWVARLVRNGELDAGFYLGSTIHTKSEPALYTQALTQFSYHVIAPKTWGARVRGKTWTEVAALPWIWTPSDSIHNRLLTSKFDALGTTPVAVAEVDQEASMLDMVRAGVGLSLARDSVALRESQASGLLMIDELSIRTELSFISLASRKDDPLVKAAFSAVSQAFQ